MKVAAAGALVMIAVCGGFFAYFTRVALHDARVRNSYRPARCTVLRAEPVYTPDSDSTSRKPYGTWWSTLTVRYATPSGVVTAIAQSSPATSTPGHPRFPERVERFAPGAEVPCWYDPEATGEVTVEQPGYKTAFALLVPLAGIVGGIMALREVFR